MSEFLDISEDTGHTVDSDLCETSLLHFINTRLYYERNVVSFTSEGVERGGRERERERWAGTEGGGGLVVK